MELAVCELKRRAPKGVATRVLIGCKLRPLDEPRKSPRDDSDLRQRLSPGLDGEVLGVEGREEERESRGSDFKPPRWKLGVGLDGDGLCRKLLEGEGGGLCLPEGLYELGPGELDDAGADDLEERDRELDIGIEV